MKIYNYRGRYGSASFDTSTFTVRDWILFLLMLGAAFGFSFSVTMGFQITFGLI